MSQRYRLLIAIETNELRVWRLIGRVLERVRERAMLAGAGVDDALATAIAWAADAERARRGEIAYLSRRSRLSQRAAASGTQGGSAGRENEVGLAA